MTVFLVDFAGCKCGNLTAIRPTRVVIPGVNPQPLEPDADSILVACNKCKRVYPFDTDDLESHQTTMGIGPYSPDAPLSVFRVSLECDDLDCQAQIQVIANLNSRATDAELEKEKASWRWVEGDLTCDVGHVLPYPQYH